MPPTKKRVPFIERKRSTTLNAADLFGHLFV